MTTPTSRQMRLPKSFAAILGVCAATLLPERPLTGQQYGLTSRQAFSAYHGGALPTTAPTGSANPVRAAIQAARNGLTATARRATATTRPSGTS